MIEMSDCPLETNQEEIAEKVCKDLVDVINSLQFPSDAKLSCSSHDNELRRLAEAFVSIDYKTSILLNRCSFKLCKKFCGGMEKINRLRSATFVMRKIVEEMNRVNKIADFKDQLPFMEEMLEEMQETACDDVKNKCFHITKCLQDVGFCCNYTKSYQRSVEVYLQAICLMKSVFGVNAKKYEVYGHCHNNIRNTYTNTGQPESALRAYLAAKDAYESAEDISNEQKNRFISATNRNIQNVP